MPYSAVLSMGSNIGDRLKYLNLAIDYLKAKVTIQRVSDIYESTSWGFDSSDFLNLCLLIETSFSPNLLLKEILAIEKKLGRERLRPNHYQPRTIDIDIISAENIIMNTSELTIPHPKMINRNFILIPLKNIAPNWMHPVTSKSIDTLLKENVDKGSVVKFIE